MCLLKTWTLSIGLTAALLAVLTLASRPGGSTSAPPVDASPSVWSFGYAKTHPGEQANYLTFLRFNWAEARRRAAREGVVRSYRVLVRPDAGEAAWDVMMVTEYADSTAYANREAYFSTLFARPDWTTRLVDGKTGREMAALVGEELALHPVVELR